MLALPVTQLKGMSYADLKKNSENNQLTGRQLVIFRDFSSPLPKSEKNSR